MKIRLFIKEQKLSIFIRNETTNKLQLFKKITHCVAFTSNEIKSSFEKCFQNSIYFLYSLSAVIRSIKFFFIKLFKYLFSVFIVVFWGPAHFFVNVFLFILLFKPKILKKNPV